MPNVEVTIPNLVPGKRYRMVIEPNNGQAVGPSIEFKVPSAAKLISSYRPTYSKISEPWSTATTTIETTIVKGAWVEVGDEGGNTKVEAGSRGWKRTNGNVTYWFWTRDYTNLGIGGTYRMTGIDSYYDSLNWKVTHIYKDDATIKYLIPTGVWSEISGYGNRAKVVMTATTNTGAAGTAKSTGSSANASTFYYYTPPIPAVRYQKADTSSSRDVVTTTTGTYYHVKLTTPADLVLMNTDTVFDMPVFVYIKNGEYYYFNDTTLNSTKVSGILNPPTISGKPSTVPLNATNNNANEDIVSRDYRFTVARYELINNSWVGRWLQTDSLFQGEQNPNKIIFSQSGVAA